MASSRQFIFLVFLSIASFATAAPPVKHGQSKVWWNMQPLLWQPLHFLMSFAITSDMSFSTMQETQPIVKNLFYFFSSANLIWLNYFVCREIIREIGSHANAKIWMMDESGKPQRSNAKNCDIKKGKPQLLNEENSNVHWISQTYKVAAWKMKAWENDKLVAP